MIVQSSDVLVFHGPESEKGNYGYNCVNVAMHDEYFRHVADCAVDDESTPSLAGESLPYSAVMMSTTLT
jgi:hypothetical protein